jgi:two-component system response regulator DegU
MSDFMGAYDKSGIWVSYLQVSPPGGRKAPEGKIRILLVDDHTVYRRSLHNTFELETDIEVVGEAPGGQEAIEMAGQLKPDIVLMDINMPSMSGIEATRQLTDVYPGMLVVLLTMFKEQEHLREARRAGASAYVMKDAGVEILLDTIRNVMSGQTPLLEGEGEAIGSEGEGQIGMESNQATTTTSSVGTDYLITSNERAILKLLVEGCDNNQIAEQMNLPESMVRTYIAEICRKLGLPGREAAILYAKEKLEF